ncbi:hypothetical protein [Planococcus sp. ISL-109]|uniref:hypothetical protein n=1 Tax=Planococcus sp. ISL-109 TaxID=2819166 RepID=UPI001BEA4D2B|nr:hypothetical protein [Planococcus sp. ISL-109]MBT2582605.1 hypothetical protein [Planococcus sp. ISL-109]
MGFEKEFTNHVNLNQQELNELRAQLEDSFPQTQTEELDSVRGILGKEPDISIKENVEEILNTYKKGVEIAKKFNSYPLIPLFKKEKKEIPPHIEISTDVHGYTYHVLKIVFDIWIPENESIFLRKVELALNITDDVEDKTRLTVADSFFPENQYQDIFNFNGKLEVGIDSNFKIGVNSIKINTPVGGVEAGAKLNTKFSSDLIMNLGVLTFQLAQIEAKGKANNKVLWKFHTQLKNTSHECIVILQVPKEATQVTIDVATKAYPFKHGPWSLFSKDLPPWYDRHTMNIELGQQAKN